SITARCRATCSPSARRPFRPAAGSARAPSKWVRPRSSSTGGTGQAMVNGKWHAIAPETLVYVGRGASHGIADDSAEHLALAWIVTPPGFEGLVRAIGCARTPGTTDPVPFDAPKDLAAACRRARIALA